MRCSIVVSALLAFSAASAGPLLRERQEGENTTVGTGDGGDTTTVGSVGTVSATSPPGSSPSPPTSSPAPENDCPPCTSEGYRTHTSPSGRTCICLDGSTEPWSWADKKCVNDAVGLPNDEGRPYFCLGSGDNPSSRACLSNCNFMLNTINSVNPCNPNLYNAARSCATCVPGGAIHYQLDGRSPNGPYINGESSMNTFMDGLKNWCALPSRCLDLTSGGKISGTGGCPVLSQNNSGTPSRGGSTTTRVDGGSTTFRQGASSATATRTEAAISSTASPVSSRSSSVIRSGTGSSSSSRDSGTTIPARIVTTSTISTTDAQGRPTFSIELATVDNPNFTGNSGFAGARPSASSEGAAISRRRLPTYSALLVGLLSGLCFF